MPSRKWAIATPLILSLLVGCESQQSVETELQINELETQVAELDQQLTEAWTQMSQLSAQLNSGVNDLDAALNHLNLRVMDLPGSDPQFTIPEVEAALAVALQRLATVRGTSQEIAGYMSN